MKSGDKVRCINNKNCPLVLNHIFTVSGHSNQMVYLEELFGRGWAEHRFELVDKTHLPDELFEL